MKQDWVKVFDSQESLKISIAKAKLDEHNIENVILNKKDSAYVVIGLSELYVPEDQARKAIQILENARVDS
ncbi:MAG: DUF2007 domain-containing protein [Saprospiraceae bacterium]|nr:DUF2007 domain-containing protein [Saprospiraceae bacterium]